MTENETKQMEKQDIPIELPGCIAYPTGEGCPIDWCRRARGDWCKDKHGNLCKWKRI